MLKLNRAKDFGKISPPFQQEDWDRPAITEQNGHFFDSQDCEIVAGVPGPAMNNNGEEEGNRQFTPAELASEADGMPYAQFRRQAVAILGKSCPAGKPQIIEALRRSQRNGNRPPAETPNKIQIGTGIDLPAWGRGKRNYLFAEVRKEIRNRFNANVTTTRDAVSLLINEGVVPAAEARPD